MYHPLPSSLLAGWESEGGDACAPVERACGLQVLGRVPEGAVVNRVNRYRAVVAPAAQTSGLRAAARNDARLCAERARCVARCARSEAYGREERRAGDAI